jgi:chloramphenicol-sensitive protein RarD
MGKPLGKGIFFAIAAYLFWGLLPMYWKMLAAINSMHILAFRIIFSFFFVSIILLIRKNFHWLDFFKDIKKLFLIMLAAIIISFNWGLYIWAVNHGYTIQTALGYYINPLISVVFGLVFFREKLKPLQWIALGLAFSGVLMQTFFSGSFPWISLSLAFSFGLYGLIKKTVKLPALESLGAETLLACPIGLALLFFPFMASELFPEGQGLSYLARLPARAILLLLCSGAATSIPLYLFGKSVKMIPLSTIGFLQFLAPTMAFLQGVFIFREHFPLRNLAVFCFIWAAVILYVLSLRLPEKKRK